MTRYQSGECFCGVSLIYATLICISTDIEYPAPLPILDLKLVLATIIRITIDTHEKFDRGRFAFAVEVGAPSYGLNKIHEAFNNVSYLSALTCIN